jgi:hypothetical protein
MPETTIPQNDFDFCFAYELGGEAGNAFAVIAAISKFLIRSGQPDLNFLRNEPSVAGSSCDTRLIKHH